MTSPTPQFTAPLLTPRRLAALLDAAVLDAQETDVAPATAPLVLDVRWRLGGPPGRADHEAGHVPGAVFVDLDTELAGAAGCRWPPPAARTPARPAGGPAPGRGVAALPRGRLRRRHGCRRRAGVVAAALGRAAGGAGRGARRRLPGVGRGRSARHRGSRRRPAPGDVVVRPGGMPVVDADGAAELARHGVLLDARAGARYRGETEPVDARAGHVPGARNAPATEHLGPDGRWLPPTTCSPGATAGARCRPGRRRRPGVGAYCGSGVNATAVVLALEYAGPPCARRARRALPGFLVAVVRRPRPPRRDRRRAVSGRVAVLARTSGRSTGARRRRDHLGSPP